VAALRAVGSECLAQIVVAWAAVRNVFVPTGQDGELVFQEVADGIAFEEEGLCFLFRRHIKIRKISVKAAGDGDTGVAEDVRDLGFTEAGAVVFKGEMELGVVELKAAKAVGVGEFAEGAELVVSERGLQFEFGFEKCHGESIARV